MANAKKIIIIGAGASGFAAAAKLISNGFKNVLILEAENRIGGRIHTVPFGANVLDIGAQWCHGEEGNVVFELANDKNVLSSDAPRYDKFNFVRSNGDAVPEGISEKLMSLGFQIFDSNDKVDEKRTYNGSLGNYFAQEYELALKSDEFGDIDVNLQREVFEWFHQYQNMYVACDSWYKASMRNSLEYWECAGDLLLNWKDRGYRTVLDLLQNKVPVGSMNVIDVESKVLLNKEVIKITYDTTNSRPNRIKITCSDHSEYFCDHLICTVSLGVLKKRHLSWFEPLLPPHKIRSIQGMGFGTVDKIYIEFTKPFWNKDWDGMSFLWKQEQLKDVRTDPINGEWLEFILGIYTVSFQPNILCGWIAGNAASKMEQVSDRDFETGVRRALEIFLKDTEGAEVKRIIRSKWSSNPHFFGSYSYYTLESDAIGASPFTLAEPVFDCNSKPIIQFAGEATSIHYHSTVHGAVQTGWIEAQRLIDLYRFQTDRFLTAHL